MKNARAHLINYIIKLSEDRKDINLQKIKELLKLGNALDDTSHWSKMSDSYVIAVFQFTSFF